MTLAFTDTDLVSGTHYHRGPHHIVARYWQEFGFQTPSGLADALFVPDSAADKSNDILATGVAYVMTDKDALMVVGSLWANNEGRLDHVCAYPVDGGLTGEVYQVTALSADEAPQSTCPTYAIQCDGCGYETFTTNADEDGTACSCGGTFHSLGVATFAADPCDGDENHEPLPF